MTPIGWEKLREYQRRGAERLANGEIKGLWFATGTGKTATALAAVGLTDLWPCLIVTRTIGRSAWVRDAAWVLGPDYVPGIVVGTLEKPDRDGQRRSLGQYSTVRDALRDRQAVVINYEIIRARHAELLEIGWRSLILDEAHAIKGGYQQQRTKRDGSPHKDVFRLVRDIASAVRRECGQVWEITATPIKDRTRDLWAQLELATPGAFGSAWKFLHHYCGAYQGPYGLVTSGLSNEAELQERLAKIFWRITRAEVASQLPKLTRNLQTVPKDYTKTDKFGGSIETAIAAAAEMKLEAALEIAEEYLISGCKVLVIVNRRKFVPFVLQKIQQLVIPSLPRPVRDKLWAFGVSGETEALRRVEVLRSFNNRNDPAIGVATIDCLSESIDLHQIDAAVVMALPYTPGLLTQFEGRFSRLGGRPCSLHYLIAEETIDERVRELLLSKIAAMDSLRTDTAGMVDAGALFDQGQQTDEEVAAELRRYLGGV